MMNSQKVEKYHFSSFRRKPESIALSDQAGGDTSCTPFIMSATSWKNRKNAETIQRFEKLSYSSGGKEFVQGAQHGPGSSKTEPLNDEKDVQKLSRFYNKEKSSRFFSVEDKRPGFFYFH